MPHLNLLILCLLVINESSFTCEASLVTIYLFYFSIIVKYAFMRIDIFLLARLADKTTTKSENS